MRSESIYLIEVIGWSYVAWLLWWRSQSKKRWLLKRRFRVLIASGLAVSMLSEIAIMHANKIGIITYASFEVFSAEIVISSI